MKRYILILPLIALCGGCMSMANLAEQLKNDPATIKVNVSTIYGTFVFERSFPTNWTQPVVLSMPVTVSTNATK